MPLHITCESNPITVICGVDEAGKGAVLGPMVVAAVGAENPRTLEGMGIKDSKALTRRRREELFGKIEERYPVAVIVIPAEEIDRRRGQMTMNGIVARAHAEVISMLAATQAYVDACDVDAARYGTTVHTLCTCPCDVVAEHGADRRYALVGAASIVAKVIRDRAIDELAGTYGIIGSGYPSDQVTIAFLERYTRSHAFPPPCARKSWKTVTGIMDQLNQKKIFDF